MSDSLETLVNIFGSIGSWWDHKFELARSEDLTIRDVNQLITTKIEIGKGKNYIFRI